MITLIDGGMGGELIRRGAATNGGLWSAAALINAPEAVVQTHADYISAGARIIITNSYSSIPSYLGKQRLAHRYEELTSLAGQLARRAASASGEQVRVAGSLPPLAESYRADLVHDDAPSRSIYRTMAAALKPHVDLFICETMSSVSESLNAAHAAAQTGLPFFVSWSLKEEAGAGLRSGETISAAFKALEPLGAQGYLFNCTSPEAIESAIVSMTKLTRKPIGGYPNRMEKVPEGWTLDSNVHSKRRKELDDTAFYVTMAKRAIDKGATLYGGCCGIGPEYIAALRDALEL